MVMQRLQGCAAIIVFSAMILFYGEYGLAAKIDRVGGWTGYHTRLVWLQDQGDGTDALAEGKNLMLYGYDSRDGLGERPLLPKVDNYFRPIITPDGRQVLFSNRLTRKMYVLDWESGKVSDLGDGVAVAVWEDPKPSLVLRRQTLWVYCFSDLQPENKYSTSKPLYRFPLNKPKKKELIWDKSHMTWDNIQLSRDGRVLGGLFPWPDGGVLLTNEKRWHRVGNGCWTSLSPDNSKLLWIFDGFHRNIQVHDIVDGQQWIVNINNAPGIGGFEVYHPRWSNHPRYFVMTGPYEKGEGGNRIGGGGEKVEIYIGRFDERAKKVEDWIKVTENGRADFYPELWIEGGNKANLAERSGKPTAAVQAEKWPVVRDHLAFVWENVKAANQLDEKSPVGIFQCNIELRGRAVYTRQLELTTTAGFGETGEAGRKVAVALAGSGQGSIEMTLTQAAGSQGSLFSLSDGEREQLQLLVTGDGITARSETTGATASWTELFAADKVQHLVANFDTKHLEIFIDGRSGGRKALKMNPVGLTAKTLRFGDVSGSLKANLSGIAVYTRELSQAEISSNSRLAHGRMGKKAETAALVVEGTLQETTEIPAPDALGAYRRALVVNSYAVQKVVQGDYGQSRILVAEWAILDGKVIKSYEEPRRPEQLVLEKFADHPQLEGERQMMDVFEPDLEMYYRLP